MVDLFLDDHTLQRLCEGWSDAALCIVPSGSAEPENRISMVLRPARWRAQSPQCQRREALRKEFSVDREREMPHVAEMKTRSCPGGWAGAEDQAVDHPAAAPATTEE